LFVLHGSVGLRRHTLEAAANLPSATSTLPCSRFASTGASWNTRQYPYPGLQRRSELASLDECFSGCRGGTGHTWAAKLLRPAKLLWVPSFRSRVVTLKGLVAIQRSIGNGLKCRLFCRPGSAAVPGAQSPTGTYYCLTRKAVARPRSLEQCFPFSALGAPGLANTTPLQRRRNVSEHFGGPGVPLSRRASCFLVTAPTKQRQHLRTLRDVWGRGSGVFAARRDGDRYMHAAR